MPSVGCWRWIGFCAVSPPVLKTYKLSDDKKNPRPRQSFHCQSRPRCDQLGLGRVGGTRSCPAIGGGIVSSASIKIHLGTPSVAAPDNHFTARPHCGVIDASSGAFVVLVAVQLSVLGLYLPPVFTMEDVIISAPDDHFTVSPHCCVTISAMGASVVLVDIQLSVLGLYLPPVFKTPRRISTTPDDHFTAGPDCACDSSRVGRVGHAGGCPTVGAGIISPAGVANSRPFSAPDDHFTASPGHTAV